jgi:hypothetical protein
MKKLISLLSILLCVVSFLPAQNNSEKNQENQSDLVKISEAYQQILITRISEMCKLTPSQQVKVETMVSGYVRTKVKNKEKYSDATSRKIANEENKKKLIECLNNILDSDQQQKLQECLS